MTTALYVALNVAGGWWYARMLREVAYARALRPHYDAAPPPVVRVSRLPDDARTIARAIREAERQQWRRTRGSA